MGTNNIAILSLLSSNLPVCMIVPLQYFFLNCILFIYFWIYIYIAASTSMRCWYRRDGHFSSLFLWIQEDHNWQRQFSWAKCKSTDIRVKEMVLIKAKGDGDTGACFAFWKRLQGCSRAGWGSKCVVTSGEGSNRRSSSGKIRWLSLPFPQCFSQQLPDTFFPHVIKLFHWSLIIVATHLWFVQSNFTGCSL